MSQYPDGHHPVMFLQNALTALGVETTFARDERTRGCWGLIFPNGKVFVWLIDNRHTYEAEREDPAAQALLASGALVCCAQKPDAERVSAKWLPLAVTPGYRAPTQRVAKLYDVAFVGYLHDGARAQMLSHVARHFKLATAQGLFGADAVALYWQAKVGLNIPTNYGAPDAYDSANMRCFEILATGTPLVTAEEPYLKDIGILNGINCFTYTNADTMLGAIQLALDDADRWALGHMSPNVGHWGAKTAAEYWTYEQRAKQVLAWLK